MLMLMLMSLVRTRLTDAKYLSAFDSDNGTLAFFFDKIHVWVRVADVRVNRLQKIQLKLAQLSVKFIAKNLPSCTHSSVCSSTEQLKYRYDFARNAPNIYSKSGCD